MVGERKEYESKMKEKLKLNRRESSQRGKHEERMRLSLVVL